MTSYERAKAQLANALELLDIERSQRAEAKVSFEETIRSLRNTNEVIANSLQAMSEDRDRWQEVALGMARLARSA